MTCIHCRVHATLSHAPGAARVSAALVPQRILLSSSSIAGTNSGLTGLVCAPAGADREPGQLPELQVQQRAGPPARRAQQVQPLSRAARRPAGAWPLLACDAFGPCMTRTHWCATAINSAGCLPSCRCVRALCTLVMGLVHQRPACNALEVTCMLHPMDAEGTAGAQVLLRTAGPVTSDTWLRLSCSNAPSPQSQLCRHLQHLLGQLSVATFSSRNAVVPSRPTSFSSHRPSLLFICAAPAGPAPIRLLQLLEK